MLLQKKEKGRKKKIIFFPFFLAVSCSLNELPVRSVRQAGTRAGVSCWSGKRVKVPVQTALKASEVNLGLASTGTAGPDTAGVFRSHAAVFCKGNGVSSVRACAAQLH